MNRHDFDYNDIDGSRRCKLCERFYRIGDTIGKCEGVLPAQEESTVHHPSHYNAGKVECIDAIESATVDLTGMEAVCTANVIKYLWRWKRKNGLEDLEKAEWYLKRLINSLRH